MSASPLEEFLAIVRRDLGAVDARIVKAADAPPADSPPEPTRLACVLPGERRLVVTFDAPPADLEAKQLRLEMLVESFDSVLAPPPELTRARPIRPEPDRSLHEELAALAQRAASVDALVIDATSPVVWGTAGEERAAPALAPAADSPARIRASGGLRDVQAEATELARLSRQYGLASATGLWLDPRAIDLVPRAICDRHRLVPLSCTGDTLVVAMRDPRDAAAIYDVVLATGLNVDPVIAGESLMKLFARWYDGRDTRTYEEALAAIDPAERGSREIAALAAKEAWSRHVASRRAVTAVRALPEMPTLHRGGHLHHTVLEPGFGYVARSFAGIYVLLLVFDAPFDELRAKRAVLNALPAVERLVLALPPLEPPPRLAGVVSLRGRRRKR